MHKIDGGLGSVVGEYVAGSAAPVRPTVVDGKVDIQAVIGQAAAQGLRVRIPTVPSGARTLLPADLIRIGRNPALLQSEFKSALSPTALADQLQAARAWAVKGQELDFVVGNRDRLRLDDAMDVAPVAAPDKPSTTFNPGDKANAFTLKGTGVSSSYSSWWDSFCNFLSRLFGGCGKADNQAEWREKAVLAAAAGGPQLRAMVNDPAQKDAVLARFSKSAMEANKSLGGSEAADIADALYRELQALYAKVPENRLSHYKGLLLETDLPADGRALVGRFMAFDTFHSMSLGDQTRFLRVVTGPDTRFSAPIRQKLREMVDSADYQALSPADRAQAIKALLNSWPPDVGSMGAPAGTFDGKRAKYDLSEPERLEDVPLDIDERGKPVKAACLSYTLTIDGQSIKIYVATQKNPKEPNLADVEQVAKAVAALPPGLRRNIHQLIIHNERNPQDKQWAVEYGDPAFRSVMTAAGGIVNVYPGDKPWTQVDLDTGVLHETGHLLTQAAWGPETDPRWDDWKKAMQRDPIACSQYARMSPGEDFCETLKLYTLVKGTPEEAQMARLFPERFRILKELLERPRAAAASGAEVVAGAGSNQVVLSNHALHDHAGTDDGLLVPAGYQPPKDTVTDFVLPKDPDGIAVPKGSVPDDSDVVLPKDPDGLATSAAYNPNDPRGSSTHRAARKRPQRSRDLLRDRK